MLILLRIVLGGALFYLIGEAYRYGRADDGSSFLIYAGYLALCVIVGILNAAAWAPYFGEKISDPLTGMLTDGSDIEYRNLLVRWAYGAQEHGRRRLALCWCFLEGIRHPDRPAAFILGLKNSEPGSWFERVFAKEVYRFHNIQNCLRAYSVLKQHGLRPPAHELPDVNLAILAMEREHRLEAEPIPVPHAPREAPLKRDPRIQLFESGATAGGSTATKAHQSADGTAPSPDPAPESS